ncbi:RIP metalloprotease RseP [Bacillus carboniphilus]|uniref:Zinc metalloprotease n=1 Tax=Bacillus carboniphilus TaxID=86663 RepID=A0ABY9JVV1_9BACI|nr:RIP metalloprotease RseP [Bacillus carboniphilus]WLR43510.1 RIP metalloprotease RseP [Bacillus carboniphilus]
MSNVLAFILVFGVLVFVHELGHLIFASRAGILCREFAIGFGPKVFAFKRKETVYTIRLLPIGGYVKMAGEDPEVIELKPGHNVGLLFNDQGEVDKIVLNNKERYPDARIIEVQSTDLEHDMVITGYEQGDDEQLQTFNVSKVSFFIVDGQEIQIAPYDRQFGSKTILQRFKAILAGPAMNFVLAFVIFVLLAMIRGIPTDDPLIGKVIDNEPAQEAGFEQGDLVKSINGQSVASWEDITDIIVVNPDQELTFLIDRAGIEQELSVTPKTVERENGETAGIIGVYQYQEKSFINSFSYGATTTISVSQQILIALGNLISGQFSIDDLSGPAGIYHYTGEVAQSGFTSLMQWTAFLSINLGIMNLLPIPALDGGRLTFLTIEAIRGKPIDSQKEGFVTIVGFALLFLLMIVVTWNDIQRFFL